MVFVVLKILVVLKAIKVLKALVMFMTLMVLLALVMFIALIVLTYTKENTTKDRGMCLCIWSKANEFYEKYFEKYFVQLNFSKYVEKND